MQKSPDKNFNLIPEDGIRQFSLLAIFGIIMFFLRTTPVYDLIFTKWAGDYGNFINFSADDAVYHMRLVHNTLEHFPWRVFFDPFTHFPFGNQIHFGPLFTLIIAAASLIIGLGHPSPELVNIVGAYTPVVMGVLCLIPLYFTAKKLAGGKAAIITAFILTFLPGAFLQRSSLGFTDHHVAEVLFSTIACAFLIYALANAKFSNNNRMTIVYGTLSGLSMGLFILVWPAALMFSAIFLIFFITQLIIDHSKNSDPKYLLNLAIITYAIPAIMVLPYALMYPHFDLTYYSLTQPIILAAMAAVFTISFATHRLYKKYHLAKYLYPLILIAISTLIFYALRNYAPKLFAVIEDGCKLLFEPKPGMKTITEVRSSLLSHHSNEFSILRLWGSYFWAMLLVVIGIGNLGYRIYKKSNPTEVFTLIWTLAIISSALAQCRFNYYLAINVAIIAGCYAVYPFFSFLSKIKTSGKIYPKLQKLAIYLFFSIFILLIIDPILMFLIDKSIPTGLQVNQQWYNTFIWLKKNTPDPYGSETNKNLNYASGYYPIPKDPSSPYKYPKDAYSIMAWWEIGHQLTYIAERIPNSNPFQLGVIESNPKLGAAPFFTSSDEKTAIKNLDEMGSRYVLIDQKTASNIEGIAIWQNDTEGWTKPFATKITILPAKSKLTVPVDSEKFKQSMLSRLYYDDAEGLNHFRLIHESDGDYNILLRRAILRPDFDTNLLVSPIKDYKTAVKKVDTINKVFWANKEKNVLAYQARRPTKTIKVFEKVKGATIHGTVSKNISDGTELSITLKLKTKFDRLFTYKQTTRIKDGKYKFVVPYPTEAMQGDNYSYDIKPISQYEIHVGQKTIKIPVSEKEIMSGKNIIINIFLTNNTSL